MLPENDLEGILKWLLNYSFVYRSMRLAANQTDYETILKYVPGLDEVRMKDFIYKPGFRCRLEVLP